MSAAPQRGRRRAEPIRRASARGTSPARTGAHGGAHAAEQRSAFSAAATTTAKCMAAVAVVGALVATGAVVQQISAPASGISAVAAVASLPDVQSPADAAISFPGLEVASSASTKSSANPDQVKVEADSVQAVTPPSVVDDPAAAQAYAAAQLAGFGWGADQMSCLTQLWQRESEWLTSAENVSSGAYGIAQSLPAEKMASAGADYRSNYQTQIRWGLGYIQGRYGSPCGAWGHSNAVGWY